MKHNIIWALSTLTILAVIGLIILFPTPVLTIIGIGLLLAGAMLLGAGITEEIEHHFLRRG